MVFISKFKQPNEAQDKYLMEVYNSLTDEHKAKVDKQANRKINALIGGGIAILALFLFLAIFIMVVSEDGFGIGAGLFCLLLNLYPLYLITHANSWKKALPHQRIPLVKYEVMNYLNKQSEKQK